MTEPDTDLVIYAQRGDRSAFAELVRRTSRLLYARFYIDIGCPHRVEDLIQDTFLLAYRSLGQLKDPDGFRAWLLVLARHVLIDDVRKGTRVKRLVPALTEVPLLTVPGVGPAPDEAAEREELREQVLATLRTLPDQYRLPITLRYIVGDSNEAIGEHLGVSAGAVRSLIFRGLKLLRKRLPPVLRGD